VTEGGISLRRVIVAVGAVLGAIVGLVVLFLVIGSVYNAYSRYQARANADNRITLNDTKIRQTQQLVKVAQQNARIEVARAKGIHTAQDIINGTLTPLYVQHEAIQAEIALAKSQHADTVIYIPVGANGVPLVSPTGQQVLQGGTGK